MITGNCCCACGQGFQTFLADLNRASMDRNASLYRHQVSTISDIGRRSGRDPEYASNGQPGRVGA